MKTDGDHKSPSVFFAESRPGKWRKIRIFCCCEDVLSWKWGYFRDVLLLLRDFVLEMGVFPGCFAAVEDFVQVLGVFPGCFAAAEDFVLEMGGE